MARRRMIDPNFWQSEDISKLTIFERLLFIGMFSNADDEGRGRANEIYLKSVIFPYDNISVSNVEKAIKKLREITSIIFYEIDENKYYFFENWLKWQRVDKPQKSNIPTFEGHSDNQSGISRESVGNDSCLKEVKGKEVKREEKGKEENARVTFADNVFMTDLEHQKLVEKFGESATNRMIEILDNYKGSSGKKYTSDYRAILSWVVERFNEEQVKSGSPKNKQASMLDGLKDLYREEEANEQTGNDKNISSN